MESVIPRGSIASRSYRRLMNILIDEEFHEAVTRTLAEQCDIGEVTAFQVCRRSPRVSIQ
jgi:hypothetical protein